MKKKSPNRHINSFGDGRSWFLGTLIALACHPHCCGLRPHEPLAALGSAWKSTTDPSTSKETQATCPAGPTFDVLIVYTFSRITKRENRLLASAFLQAPREKVLNEGSETADRLAEKKRRRTTFCRRGAYYSNRRPADKQRKSNARIICRID